MPYTVSLTVVDIDHGHEWTVETRTEPDSVTAEVWRRLTARWCGRKSSRLPDRFDYRLPPAAFVRESRGDPT